MKIFERDKMKTLGGVMAVMIAFILAIGYSYLQPEAKAAGTDLSTVPVHTYVTSTGTENGTVQSSVTLMAPVSMSGDTASIVVNPDASILADKAPSARGVVITYSDGSGDMNYGINASQVNASNNKPWTLNGKNGSVEDFKYDSATGVLTVQNFSKHAANGGIAIYNYISASQTNSNKTVYASELLDGSPVTLKGDSLNVDGTSYNKQNQSDSWNVIFNENPYNGGSSQYAGYQVSSVTVTGLVLNAQGQVTAKYDLSQGTDYDYRNNTISFHPGTPISTFIVKSEVKTLDQIKVVLDSRTSTSLKFVPAAGCTYLLTADGEDDRANDTGEFTGLTQNKTYRIYYKKGDQVVAEDRFSTNAEPVYSKMFNVGDNYEVTYEYWYETHERDQSSTTFRGHVTDWTQNYDGVTNLLTDDQRNLLENSVGTITTTCVSPGRALSDVFASHQSNARITVTNVDDSNGQVDFRIDVDGVPVTPSHPDYPDYTTQDSLGYFSIYQSRPFYIDIYKVSSAPDITNTISGYSMSGAEYTIYSDADCTTPASMVDGSSSTLVLGADGYAMSGELNCAQYWVKETKAPTGFKMDYNTYPVDGTNLAGQVFRVNQDAGVAYDSTAYVSDAPILMPPPEVHKQDLQSGSSTPEGGASLQGVILKVHYNSIDNQTQYDWYMETDDNGYATLDDAHFKSSVEVDGQTYESAPLIRDDNNQISMPVGNVSIQEVTAPKGYLLTDSSDHSLTYSFDEVDDNGNFTNQDDRNAQIADQVIRGDIKGNKIEADHSQRLSGIPFLLTLKTSDGGYESHVIVTDDNGNFDTSVDNNAHTSNTNGNDQLVTNLSNVTVNNDDDNQSFSVDTSNLQLASSTIVANDQENNGIWFSGYSQADLTEAVQADDELGALPYGSYSLDEIPCDNNAQYEMVHRNFTIGTKLNNKTLDLGTLSDNINSHSPREAYTQASNEGLTTVDGEQYVNITDSITYQGFDSGTYQMKTYLIDKSLYNDGLSISDNIQNASIKDNNGDPIVKESQIVITDDQANLSLVHDVDMSIPYSLVEDKEVVVFDVCNDEIQNKLSHCDINAESQTLTFPSIRTTATDEETGTHDGAITSDTVTIKDTVTYENLTPGKPYKMNGTLMDKDTGDKLIDENGSPFTATVDFTPTEKNGSVDLEFTIPSSVIEGKTVVAFEDCSDRNGRVATHADIEDEGQTVHYPKLGTTATDNVTNDHDGLAEDGSKVIINDVVSYDNLIKGQQYTIKGELMDKDSGESLGITAEKTFIAGDEDVSPVPEQDDETAVDNDNTIMNEATDEDTTIEDATNDEPVVTKDSAKANGDEVEITNNNGTEAANDATDEPTTNDNANEPEAANDEQANQDDADDENQNAPTDNNMPVFDSDSSDAEHVSGTVTLTYEMDANLVRGKRTVVFERLYQDDKQVVAHEDINDTNQEVDYPDIHTTARFSNDDVSTMNDDKTSLNIDNARIIDTVSYTNLIPGQTYIMDGVLMDKETGESVKDANGQDVFSTASFVPDASDGTIDMEFVFDATSLSNHDVVVYENAYRVRSDIDDLIHVGKHEDINDQDQTVHIKGQSDAADELVIGQTGDEGPFVILGLSGILAASALIAYKLRRKNLS